MATAPDDQRSSTGARAVRLPLQVGLGGLGQTTRYAATVWLGPVLLLAAAMFAPAFPSVFRILWIMLAGLGGLIVIGLAYDAADNAKRGRPSDILLDPGGIAVRGGPRDGHRYGWDELDAAACSLLEGEPRRAFRWVMLSWLTLRRVQGVVERTTVRVYELRLLLRAGGDVLIGEAEGDEERASLEAVRDSIKSTAAPPADDAISELPPEVLRCPGCGAPQVPVDRASAPCPYCGQAVEMPVALREKQRAQAELRDDDAANARLVEKLVRQPGAGTAARLLWLGRKLLVWIQPALLAYLCILVYHQTASLVGDSKRVDAIFLHDLGVIGVELVVTFAVVWSALYAYFSNRKALRVLAESFGAVPPHAPGAPCTCRQCGAPLPDAGSALLVRCAYCAAENVLGVDPRPAAARRKHEGSDLRAALSNRRKARWRLAITVVVCALVAAVATRAVIDAWSMPTYVEDPVDSLRTGTEDIRVARNSFAVDARPSLANHNYTRQSAGESS